MMKASQHTAMCCPAILSVRRRIPISRLTFAPRRFRLWSGRFFVPLHRPDAYLFGHSAGARRCEFNPGRRPRLRRQSGVFGHSVSSRSGKTESWRATGGASIAKRSYLLVSRRKIMATNLDIQPRTSAVASHSNTFARETPPPDPPKTLQSDPSTYCGNRSGDAKLYLRRDGGTVEARQRLSARADVKQAHSLSSPVLIRRWSTTVSGWMSEWLAATKFFLGMDSTALSPTTSPSSSMGALSVPVRSSGLSLIFSLVHEGVIFITDSPISTERP